MHVNKSALHAFIIFLAGLSFAIVGNIIIYIMLVKVNRRLPDDKQISYIAYGLGQIQREYKRLYPGNLLYLFPWVSGALCIVCMLLLTIAMGLFS